MNIHAIEKAIEAKLQELHIPGCAAVIVQDDQVVLMKAFGLRDVERQLPVTLHTLFPICSCTKAFTAMAAAISQDDGTLSLDDSPRRVLPAFHLHDPEADAQTTIRDLLCHRTGLMGMDTMIVADSGHLLTLEDLMRAVGSAKPTARFRQRFQYSNVLFAVAGEALARANSAPWEQIVAERIFKPLGMTAGTTSTQAMEQSDDYIQGYDYDAATAQIQQRRFPDWIRLLAPGGAILSNIKDMTQWLRLMLNGGVFAGKRLVSELSFRELIRPHIPQSERPDEKYFLGLGWYTVEWNGHRIVQANGSTAGFFASISFMPEARLGMVILAPLGVGPCDPSFFWPLLLGEPEAPATAASTPAAPVSEAPPMEQTDSAAAISADELIARMIEAVGGEETLRRHTSRVVRSQRVYENQGMLSEEALWAQAPNARATEMVWKVADKQIATVRVVFDGVLGFQEASFMPCVDFAGRHRAEMRLEAVFAPLLDARTHFESLAVTGRAKLGEEEVYVLVATQKEGASMTEYVSARSFLVLKQEKSGETLAFSDYRAIDGQLYPFQTTVFDSLGEAHITVNSVQFNVAIPDSVFRREIG